MVQVAYADAVAYATWAHKRLPTEAEWEFAARGGHAGEAYVWGDQFTPNGKWMANTHQGHFPNKDSGSDGFAGLAPVAQYPPNQYGLYDMAGNVWQWTSDWYRPDYYVQLAQIPVGGAQSKRPRDIIRSFRAFGKEEGSSRWFISVHGGVLLALYGGYSRKGGNQHKHEPSRISVRKIGTVAFMSAVRRRVSSCQA